MAGRKKNAREVLVKVQLAQIKEKIERHFLPWREYPAAALNDPGYIRPLFRGLVTVCLMHAEDLCSTARRLAPTPEQAEAWGAFERLLFQVTTLAQTLGDVDKFKKQAKESALPLPKGWARSHS